MLHQHGYDATEFTEFQVVMLILTMSGLLVGVVVSERQRADLAAREAQARLKEMQAQAGRAARMNLVSGMASALAHEINQPMTAARALARSVQQILHAPAADTERANTNIRSLVAQIDHAGCAFQAVGGSKGRLNQVTARHLVCYALNLEQRLVEGLKMFSRFQMNDSFHFAYFCEVAIARHGSFHVHHRLGVLSTR